MTNSLLKYRLCPFRLKQNETNRCGIWKSISEAPTRMAWRNGLCSFRRVDFCVTCVHQARGTGVHKSNTRGLINYLPRTNSSQVPLLAIALKSHNFTRKAMWWRKLILDEIWSIRPEVQSSFISTPFWSFVSYPNLLLWNFLHSHVRL